MRRFFWMLPISLSIACGGSDDGTDNPGNTAACVDDHLTLRGSVDGQDLTADLETTSLMFSQDEQSGSLKVGYAGGALDLDVLKSLFNGDSGPISGTIQMPDGAPRPGETLCAGNGSTITFSDPDFKFKLVDLTLGPTCPGQAVPGEIRGCARSQ